MVLENLIWSLKNGCNFLYEPCFTVALLYCKRFTVKDPFTISTNQHPNSTASDMLTLSCDMLEFVFFFSLMDTTQSSCLILDYKFPTAPRGRGASWCPYHTNVCKIRDFVQQYLCSLSSNGDQYTLTVLYR